ncbi:response regulator [Pedobacter nototheniae]|uniref:response regulator n=1 Tax=Pedobacter nototheniae TaxID=2488994 RepID=UPI002930EB99|nr:response regulator [Pedobacter nototheniae]
MILNKSASKVLLITDNLNTDELITEYLTDAEIGFTGVQNINKAAKSLKEENFELILLDINFNSLKEYNTLRRLKEDLDIKAPVVVLVNELRDEEVEKYFNLGIKGCLSKPVSKMDLAGILTQFLPDFNK